MECKACGEKLTRKEENAILKARDESSYPNEVSQLCDECEWEAQQYKDYADEGFSDADSGL